ncbi:MAG TPA: VOC family protein [Candidatus Saccharimonadia bacterium]|nr:VOC family protein [Candidatus Saccharimonadia bacterium]
MSDVHLDVYLYFQGNCKEAMEFYKSVFGGELTVQTFGESPPEAVPGGLNDENKDQVMHARLEGGDIKLMASDGSKASAKSAKVDLSLGGSDETRLREIFEKLSAGGEVGMPLTKMFWGDFFGQFVDKYGVSWMVNITKPGSMTDQKT